MLSYWPDDEPFSILCRIDPSATGHIKARRNASFLTCVADKGLSWDSERVELRESMLAQSIWDLYTFL